MNCFKWWVEVGAAVVTIVGFPLALIAFWLERRDRFIDQWSDSFNSAFTLGRKKAEECFAGAIEAASRLTLTERGALSLVITASMDALERRPYSQDASAEIVRKYLPKALQDYRDRKKAKKDLRHDSKKL